jgi:hypothetical protein
LGLYDTFVHYDIRGTKARWDYRKNKSWVKRNLKTQKLVAYSLN